MTYPEAAFALRKSIRQLQRLVQAHNLQVHYGRLTAHPRLHAFLPPETVATLRQLIPLSSKI